MDNESSATIEEKPPQRFYYSQPVVHWLNEGWARAIVTVPLKRTPQGLWAMVVKHEADGNIWMIPLNEHGWPVNRSVTRHKQKEAGDK